MIFLCCRGEDEEARRKEQMMRRAIAYMQNRKLALGFCKWVEFAAERREQERKLRAAMVRFVKVCVPFPGRYDHALRGALQPENNLGRVPVLPRPPAVLPHRWGLA